ncbi:MAG: hypothetical protein U0228_26245 [Myxococcaceae bacterium]
MAIPPKKPAPKKPRDTCPSCFQPIAPTDFLCPHCELILDPSQAPERPSGEVSVVRRLLEPPQRGIPQAGIDLKAARAKAKANEGIEGPTKKLDLGPELGGVPIVVATLSKKSEQLTELEAWLVSLIDGLSDANALAKKANLRELELRVMLRTLNEKHIIDFADEPLSDEDLRLPEVVGTLEPDDEPPLTMPAPPPPAPVAGVPAHVSGGGFDRRDSRFVVPASKPGVPAVAPARAASPAVVPAPPPAPARLRSTPGTLPSELEQEAPIIAGTAEPPVIAPTSRLPPRAPRRAEVAPSYPGLGAVVSPGPTPKEQPPERQTDPRIAYTGKANRKVLDALKQVKRSDGRAPSPTAAADPKGDAPVADILARDSLQVALRMEQNGRMDEAIRFLERSIAQSPDAASLYNRLGIILMRERADYRRAEQLIRKATELSPENGVYATNLQQVITRAALRK